MRQIQESHRAANHPRYQQNPQNEFGHTFTFLLILMPILKNLNDSLDLGLVKLVQTFG